MKRYHLVAVFGDLAAYGGVSNFWALFTSAWFCKGRERFPFGAERKRANR
jgi:hypothetical protein